MAEQKTSNKPKTRLMKIERDAIDFAQSILNGPRKGEKDSLTKLERDAISSAKRLLRKFILVK